MPRPKAPGVAEIEDNFSFHPPKDDSVAALHAEVRSTCKKAALALNKILPPGRHRSLALTKIQEAMWAGNASVALDLDKQPAPAVNTLDNRTTQDVPDTTVKAARKVAKPPAPKATTVQYHAPVKRAARRPARP